MKVYNLKTIVSVEIFDKSFYYKWYKKGKYPAHTQKIDNDVYYMSYVKIIFTNDIYYKYFDSHEDALYFGNKIISKHIPSGFELK